MYRKILFVAFLLFSPNLVLAVYEGGTTPYNYNPFYENTIIVESSWDLVLMILTVTILVLILYKGETTLENLKKINERRLKRKRIKKERKKIKKMLKK